MEEKITYILKLLIGIWLIQEKITLIQQELLHKNKWEIDEIIWKLEKYYTTQNIIDIEFIKQLDKINNDLDETLEKTIENFTIENFNF